MLTWIGTRNTCVSKKNPISKEILKGLFYTHSQETLHSDDATATDICSLLEQIVEKPHRIDTATDIDSLLEQI